MTTLNKTASSASSYTLIKRGLNISSGEELSMDSAFFRYNDMRFTNQFKNFEIATHDECLSKCKAEVQCIAATFARSSNLGRTCNLYEKDFGILKEGKYAFG